MRELRVKGVPERVRDREGGKSIAKKRGREECREIKLE